MNITNQVSSLSFANYKAFKNKQNLKINNLTLIFGYNNSGKSAILRSLPLLADSFKINSRNNYTKSYLDYNSPALRGALFNDIVTKGTRTLHLGLSWSSGSSIEFQLQQDGLEPEKIKKLEIGLPDGKREYQESLDDSFKLENVDNLDEKICFDNFRASDIPELNNCISDFSNSVHWISSTRIPPAREFEIGVGIPIGIAPSGAGTGETLWYLAETKSPSFGDINSWLEQTTHRIIDTSTSSSTLTAGARRRVKLETIQASQAQGTTSPIKVGILDSGEGIAQALPVVTLCAMAANGELGDTPLIVIEQPELHLHPKATVSLANFMIECINKNSKAKFIIETHSESFLLALQIAIVDATLELDKFSCYWVNSDSNGSTANEVQFDKNGFITNNWPQSVFRETISQSRELVMKRKEAGNGI